MKKMFAVVLTVIALVFQCNVAFAAEHQFAVQELGGNSELQMQKLDDNNYLMDISGEKYVYIKGMYSTVQGVENAPIPYNKSEYDFFIMKERYQDYIWTGNYYLARPIHFDSAPTKYWSSYNIGYPVRFYDKDFNLVKEHSFDIYTTEIGFYNGAYYCHLGNEYFKGEKYMMSTDMENWTEVSGPIPKQNGTLVNKGDDLSFDGENFYKINREDKIGNFKATKFGKWIFRRGDGYSIYLSNDNVYFVKITCPKEAYVKINGNSVGVESLRFRGFYEYGDDLIVDCKRSDNVNIRLTIPKKEIYDELEAQKNSPYILLNNEILGFEVPPVIENDRTLVPMRFIFEKMGANVEWNEQAQSASVTQKGNTVSFAIDDTNVTVNGKKIKMDVPARLVNDKTMIPLRVISEQLGYKVDWDEKTKTASIKSE